MKLNANELYSTLSFLRDIIPQNPHLQTFAYVHMSKTDKGLLLRGMDIGKYAQIAIEAVEYNDTFEDTLVPMTKLYEFLGEAKKITENITLKSGSRHITIYLDDNSTAKIAIMDAKEFPDKLELGKGKRVDFIIDSQDLSRAMSLARLTGNQYIVTQSVHLFTSDGKFYTEATNGFSGGRVVVRDSIDEQIDVILMADFERIISKSNKMFSGEWKVTVTGKHFAVKLKEDCYVDYALGTDKYPDMSNMFKNDAVSVFSLSTEDLVTNLNIIKALGDTSVVRFTIKDGTLNVTTEGNSDGSRSYEVNVGNVEDIVVKMDVLELRKVLSMLEGDTIHFQIGKNQPILVFDEDAKKKFFVVPQI